ncbi:MAG: hypothetical protein ABEK29_05800, partial [Bradymonadaceae bacterium]
MLVGGALAVLIFGIPPVVESIADRVVRDRLEGRAVDVSWRDLGWWWTDTVTFRNLEVTAGGQTLRIRRLEVDLAVVSASGEGPEPEGLRAVGVEGTIDVSAFTGADGPVAASESRGSRAAARTGRLDTVDSVALEELSVRIAHEGTMLATVTGRGRAD